MAFDRITVLGAGAWGSALANVIMRAGRRVTLWARDPDIAATLARAREGPRLPGVRLDDGISVTDDIACMATADAILVAVPAQVLRPIAMALAGARAAVPVIACAKGIEQGTRKFMSDVIAECAPRTLPAVLSGPSFAADVARGLPTAVTLAARDENTATALARALGSMTFRLYHTTDVRGVEIGGAAKNVLAIAAGIVHARGLGPSAAAALTTRGFAELFRFGKALGARPETLVGLSGLGDLILTCSSPQSRNFSLGLALGAGRSPDEARSAGKLAEGAATASVLTDLAKAKGVEMPIAGAVAAVLAGQMRVDDAIEALLARPFKAEG